MEFTIERENCNLFCRKQGEGPLLLLIHGAACDCDYFGEAIRYLEKQFTVISYDRRGYSRSILEGEDVSAAVQTEDAAIIIRRQQMGAAFVVGCSAGGIIAVSLAESYPELVSGLLLQELPIAGNAEIQEKIDDWIAELRIAAERKHINKALLSFRRVMGGVLKQSKSKSLEAQVQDLENLEVFVYHEMEDFLHYKLPEDFPKGVSCIVVAGEGDRKGLFAQAAESLAEQMRWKLVRAPGYHNLPADLPYEFAMLVLDAALNMSEKL